jgi:annexin A7/11
VELAHRALVGLGTNEMLLAELILGRSAAEIKLLIEGYKIKYGKDFVSAVMSDLSGKIERSMFSFL